MECTISSESQDQGGSGNVSGTVVHATQPDKKAELVPVDFQTVSRNFGRRREGVKGVYELVQIDKNVFKQVCMIFVGLVVREHSLSAATSS